MRFPVHREFVLRNSQSEKIIPVDLCCVTKTHVFSLLFCLQIAFYQWKKPSLDEYKLIEHKSLPHCTFGTLITCFEATNNPSPRHRRGMIGESRRRASRLVNKMEDNKLKSEEPRQHSTGNPKGTDQEQESPLRSRSPTKPRFMTEKTFFLVLRATN